MKIYSDTALNVLRAAGWNESRDVFSQLNLPKQKKVFLAAKEIYSSLGLIKLKYTGKDGVQILYFDVDDSSKKGTDLFNGSKGLVFYAQQLNLSPLKNKRNYF